MPVGPSCLVGNACLCLLAEQKSRAHSETQLNIFVLRDQLSTRAMRSPFVQRARRQRKPVKKFTYDENAVRANGNAHGPDPRQKGARQQEPPACFTDHISERIQGLTPLRQNEATSQELSPLKSAFRQRDPEPNNPRKVRLSNDVQTIHISEKIQGLTPLPQTKASRSSLKSVMRPLLSKYMGEDTKAFMRNGNYRFRRTPGERRKRDLKTTSIESLQCMLHEIFPNKEWSIDRKKEMVKPYIVEYLTGAGDGSGERNHVFLVWSLHIKSTKACSCYSEAGFEKKLNILDSLADLISDQKPKERRPIMALLTEHLTREEAEKYIDSKISKRDWRMARLHWRYPGPLKPVETMKFTRKRYNENTVANFLGYWSENFCQDHAHGDKLITFKSGAIGQIDAVSTTANAPHIHRQYIKAICPEALQRREGGCPKQNKRSGCYCMKDDNHSGQCKFTNASMLSESSIDAIIGTLAKGQLKSRAGLDDEDVEKGSRNLERAGEIYEHLAHALNHSSETIADTKKQLEWIGLYHRTDFTAHLSKNGKKCCQCLSCGLHCDEEPIPCQYRNDSEDGTGEKHDSPCQDCEKVFNIFTKLLDYANAARLLPRLVDQQENNIQQEKFTELAVELKQCHTNLIHWRSHIARKLVESQFSREQMRNLKEDEAIVVCDFKMKILNMYFRETKQQFFGKRGTSCLGFMIMTNTEGKVGEVDVTFFLFFSDDTQQDTNYVLAGKHYIYSEMLPKLFPEGTDIKVRFESDGAGCYNCNLAKAVMPFWKQWTNVEEIQIRHSVSGDGKSSLDGMFGKLSKNFKDAVSNNQLNIVNARTCLKAYESAGIKGASAGIIELDRDHDIEIKTSDPRLLASHRIVLDRQNNQLVTYANSGYGNGKEISLDNINAMFEKTPEEPMHYIVQHKCDGQGIAHHSNESYQSRLQEKKKSKRQAANDKVKGRQQAAIEEARAKRRFRCPELENLTMQQCRYECATQQALDRHIGLGLHDYPSRNLIEYSIARSALEGGVFQFGTRPQRSDAYANIDVKDGTSEVLGGDTHFQPGCYKKPPRKKVKRFGSELKRVLNEMFIEGETTDGTKKRGKNKWTAEQARKKLAEMALPSGLAKFSSSSPDGPVPTEKQIKSYWSRLASSRRLLRAKGNGNAVNELMENNDNVSEHVQELDEWVTNALRDDTEFDEDGRGDDEIREVNQQSVDQSVSVADDPLLTCEKIEHSIFAAGATRKRKGGTDAADLKGKKVVIDGEFEDINDIMVLIGKLGGKIQNNLSKNVGEYQ